MARYCVNENGDHNGVHEVHDVTPGSCSNLPNVENREDLGNHTSCHSAVREAKKTHSKVDGCYYCCNPCHTG